MVISSCTSTLTLPGRKEKDNALIIPTEGAAEHVEPRPDANARPGPRVRLADRDDRHKNVHVNPPPSIPPGDTPEALAIAIEIKCLLPILKPGTEDRCSEGQQPILRTLDLQKDEPEVLTRRAHEAVADTIQNYGQRSITLHGIEAVGLVERDYWDTHWIVKKANSAEPSAADLSSGKDYIWVPVEICSPKQRWSGQGALADSLSVISDVLRALTTHHRLTVNYTCDVHVHVGRADGQHLSLTTLKKLATMLWFSEDLIRSVRDPASPNYSNVYTWGAEMRVYSRLAKVAGFQGQSSGHGIDSANLSKLLDNSLGDAAFLKALRQQVPAIRAIWNATSYCQLGKLLSGSTRQYRRLGFNFSSLAGEDERARTGPRTVEFRVLEGTLGRAIISAWVMICWRLVEVAGEGTEDLPTGLARFVRVIKCGLGNTSSLGPEPDRQNDWEAWLKWRQHGDVILLRGQLKALVVDGLGIGEELYVAFVDALLEARRQHI